MLQAGASSMSSGEHKSQVSLDSLKFYVVGRARYKSFQTEASDAVDMRNTLPLGCTRAFESLKSYLQGVGQWATFRDALIGTRQGGSKYDRALEGFVDDVWSPAVRGELESHNGLISDEHNPQLTTGGSLCYDVKVLKLMSKKSSSDHLDLNNDLSRTRAIEILRIFHTKIKQLPDALAEVLFRGPEGDDGFEGIQSAESWPSNAADEPFASAANEDFQYNPDFVDDDNSVPTMKATARPWGLLVAIVKPGQEEEFANEYEELSADMRGGGKRSKEVSKPGDMYALVKRGPSNAFGTRKELEKLEWTTNGRATVGLKHFTEGPLKGQSVVEAWAYDESMPQLLSQLGHSRIVVFVPPSKLGKADGYYSSEDPDWASLVMWALDFKAHALFPMHASPSASRDEKIAMKVLAASATAVDPKDHGRRGGQYLLVSVNK